jgi:chromate transporter
MIPMIEREVVEKRKWVNLKDVSEVFAIAESVPGAIAINSATFIGFRIAGVRGAIAAMVGVLLPTFFIVILLSIAFIVVKDNSYIESAFIGIRAAIVALIAYAAYKIGLASIYDKTTFMIACLTVGLLFFLHVHPVWMIMGGMLAGIILVQVRDRFGIVTNIEKNNTEQEHNTIEKGEEKLPL